MLYEAGVRRRGDLFFQACSPRSDARLVVLMMVVLAVLLESLGCADSQRGSG